MPLMILWCLALTLVKFLFNWAFLEHKLNMTILFDPLDTFLRLRDWLRNKFSFSFQDKSLQLSCLSLNEKFFLQNRSKQTVKLLSKECF